MDPVPAQPPADYPRMVSELAELAGGLAHELRNPLSTIMINLKLLAEQLREEQTNCDDLRRRALLKVETLRREAERLQALFDDFLRLAGPVRLQPAETDLAATVDRLVEFFAPMARARGIEVVVRGARPLLCTADEKLVSQALLNLVINAQDAMPQGGVLTLITEGDEALARIRVCDTGVGVAPQVRDRIMRPFFSTKASGTGLGLSITRRIIEAHGGTLSFESEAGQGTTFVVTLPRQGPPPGYGGADVGSSSCSAVSRA